MKSVTLLTAVLALSSVAGAQEQKIFHFWNLDSPQAMQESVNAIRMIGELTNVSYDAAAKTVAIQGSADDLSLASWIFQQLDQNTSARQPQDFQLPGGAETVELLYFNNVNAAKSAPAIQEIANAVRTIIELPRVMPIMTSRMLLVRAAPPLINAAVWLFSNLDVAQSPRVVNGALTSSADLPFPNSSDIVRILYVHPDDTDPQFVETANVIRTIPEITRVFPDSTVRAIAIRTSPDRMAAAQWLASTMDSRPNPGLQAFPFAPDGSIIRAFPIAGVDLSTIRQFANSIRTTVLITRVFPATSVIVARGTAAQMAQAEKLLVDLEARR